MRLGPLLALTVATFALGFGELMIAGILSDVARDLQVSVAAAGALMAAYALTFALVAPPLAVALGNRDRRTTLATALVVVAAANAGAAFGTSLAAVVAFRILAAAGSAAASTLALAGVDAFAEPAARGRAHGIVFAGFSAAATLGVPFGVLVAARFTWRASFIAVAACALVAAILVLASLRGAARTEPLHLDVLRRLVRRRVLALLVTMSLVNMSGEYVVFTYIRPLLEAFGGFDASVVAALLFVYGGIGIAGNLAGGVLVDRIGADRTMLACMVALVATFAVMPVALRTWPGALVFTIVWGLLSWGFAPAVNHRLADAAGGAPDVGLALNLTAFNGGIALGASAGGIALERAGALALPPLAGALMLGAIGLAYAARETGKSPA